MRKVAGSPTDLPLGKANEAVSVLREERLYSCMFFRGDAEVGLEVCRREYILLRGPCDLVQT